MSNNKGQILVTGGTGYIGAHTVVELQQSGYQVLIVDNLSNSTIEIVDQIAAITGQRPEFVNLDLREKQEVAKLINNYPDIEAIIHFAACKSVSESVRNPL